MAEATAPANPDASADAARILRYLSALPSHHEDRVLSGQNIGTADSAADGYARFFAPLEEQTGRLPALLGVDYCWQSADAAAISQADKLLIRHWEQGGLVTLSMHPGNPWTGGGIRQRDLGGCGYRDLVTPGTEANARWMSLLKVVADGLTELRDAGVVVLWRPLHEMNGDFFWWSAGGADGWATPEEFRALWDHMFDYLCRERGLDNLLWVYAPNAETGEGLKSVTYYYPGDDRADIVGLDHYGNSLDTLNARGSYDALLMVGKPMALTEVGPAFWRGAHPGGEWDNTLVIESIRRHYPALCYFLYWQGWGGGPRRTRMAIAENRNAGALLRDPWVVTLGGVERRER